MNPDVLKQIQELLHSREYKVSSNEHHRLYLTPNFYEDVQIAYADGLFFLNMANQRFAADDADDIIQQIHETKPLVNELNDLMLRSGERKASILAWQEHMDRVRIGMNLNGSKKRWDFIRSYGIHTSTDGAPEFSSIWLWNDTYHTLYLKADEEQNAIEASGGIYNAEGEPVESIELDELPQYLPIHHLSRTECIIELEKGLGFRLYLPPSDAYMIETAFIPL